MKLKLDGAVVMITGASAGLGYEFAKQIAAKAHSLVLVARRTDKLESLRDELLPMYPSLKVSIQTCDLTKQNEIDLMLDRVSNTVGPIDVLINNAGLGDFAFYEESSWRKTSSMIELNLIAPIYLVRKLLGPMLQKKSGGILNVSSTAGLFFFPAFSGYVGTKYFLTGFTESLRSEVQGTGVTVSLLCPGPVATEFEAIARNGSGAEIPSWLEISAEKCVSLALRGFSRGQARIIPGYLMTCFVRIYAWFPLAAQRLLARAMGAWIRRSKLTLPKAL